MFPHVLRSNKLINDRSEETQLNDGRHKIRHKK